MAKVGRYCSVPMCKTRSSVRLDESPKLFFPVPKEPKERSIWMTAIGRTSHPNYNVWVCEDHFNLEKDMLNYDYVKLSGNSQVLKPNVVPHRFDCQRRPGIILSNPITKGKVEMEKFKRRLIRAVARLLIHDKKPEEEVWQSLRNETGCNCKLLWTRMRALTIKKLDRLLFASDCIDAIPKPARMSLTDWLLFDLVLAHQDIDLIGQTNNSGRDDLRVLVDLFELVKKFRIEEKEGEKLAEAWSLATLYYNTQGHQCSPMLLQRRWYQLKQATRAKFYNFWNSYRGTIKRLTLAEQYTPTPLQAAIAKSFKSLVTSPFVEWEELIKKRLIILPEEFEKQIKSRMRRPYIPEERVDDAPDLEVIEPNIETIDLRVDSDHENEEDIPEGNDFQQENDSPEENYLPEETSLPPVVTVKEEPPEMDIDIDEQPLQEPKKSMYEVVLESTSKDHETIDTIGSIEPEQPTEEEIPTVFPQIMNVFGNVDELNENLTRINASDAQASTDAVADMNAGISYVGNDEKNVNDDCIVESNNIIAHNDNVEGTGSIIIEDDCIPEPIPECGIIKDTERSAIQLQDDNVPKNDVIPVEDDSETNLDKTKEIRKDVYSIGIQKLSDDDKFTSLGSSGKIDINIKPDTTTFSFGELSNDISFVDDGIEFVDDGIEYHDEDDNVSVKIEANDEEETVSNCDDTPIIDAKLLMVPIVYTTKLDDMGIFNTQLFDHVKNKSALDIIAAKSKPIKKIPVDIQTDDDYESIVTDNQRVKLTSYMLQKPRSRTYNPIQLCRNPDFNTRLKRLTVGFFSSPRNRVLLKTCKPLTIDLSKAFEAKLVCGTLYLKPNDQNIKQEIILDDTENRQNVSVVPSAMPVQSLIDNSKIGDILPLLQMNAASPKPPDTSSHERNKVINLPDISEIRRINQRLLTAEVTPIQVQNNRPQVPVSIVPSPPALLTPTSSARIPAPVTPTDMQAPVSVSKGKTQIVDITQDLPDKNNSLDNSLTQSCSLNQTRRLIGRPSSRGRGSKTMVPWKPRNTRPAIPWFKNMEASAFPSGKEENLLTLDTLDKMLYLLNKEGMEDDKKSELKKKKKEEKRLKNAQQQTEAKVKKTADSDVQVVNETDVVPETDNIVETNKKCYCKPKINIKSVHNYPNELKKRGPKPKGSKVESSCEDNIDKKNDDGNKRGTKRDDQYCCWARQRMLQLLISRKTITPHDCPYPLCTCCCRALLKQYIVNERKLKEAEWKGMSSDPQSIADIERIEKTTEASVNIIVQSTTDDPTDVPIDTSLQTHTELCQIQPKICTENPAEIAASVVRSSTSTVVVQTTITENQATNNQNPITIVKTSVITDQTPQTDGSCEITAVTDVPIELHDLNTGDVPAIAGEVSITTSIDSPDDVVCVDNVDLKNKSSEIVTTTSKISVKKRCVRRPRQGRYPMLIQGPSKPASPILSNMLGIKKRTQKLPTSVIPKPTVTTFPNETASNIRTYATPKQLKEKMIYLNSKQISEKPSNNPIFLGKNKILLTTVKFPNNLRQFEMIKQSMRHTLPAGVQLFLLPNGTVTYFLDINASLNAEDVARMPAIVVAIQEELNATVPKQAPIVENEIVNLDDDDDDLPIIDNANKNETIENPPVVEAEVDNIENNVTEESSKNAVLHRSSSCSEINIVDLNNETTTENVIENHQDAYQNIEKGVQKPNGADVISTSCTENNTVVAHSKTLNAENNTVELGISGIRNNMGATQSEISSLENRTDTARSEVLSDENNTDKAHSEILSPEKITDVAQSDVFSGEINTVKTQSEILSLENDTGIAQPELLNDQNNADKTQPEILSPENNTGVAQPIVITDENNAVKVQSEILCPENNAGVTQLEIFSDVNNSVKVQAEKLSPEKNTVSQQEIFSRENNSGVAQPEILKAENDTVEPKAKDKPKNILSDLMAMSGIFDEDMTPTQEPVQPQPVILDNIPLTPLEPPPLQAITASQAGLDATLNLPPPPIVKSRVGELSPITSLYELKYACLNNGTFFKLDFETGFLVPINVCMKQNPKPNPPKIVEPKSVIDLTEEDETNTYNTISSPEMRSLLIANNITTNIATNFASNNPPIISPGGIKPVKMFKSPSIRQLYEDSSSANSHPGDYKQKRKQFVHGEEIKPFKKIKLIASNSEQVNSKKSKLKKRKAKTKPTEKKETEKPETAPDSTKNVPDDRKLDTEGVVINETETDAQASLVLPKEREFATHILSDDDSSDEEPLAKKIKRKSEAPATVNVIQVEVQHNEEADDVPNEKEPMVSDPHFELFLDPSEDEEDTEENCILGV